MARAANFDVVVVGGGSAGFAAAISAAEVGARTLLLERGHCLGGNAAHAFVHTICGLYRAVEDGDAISAHPGLPHRVAAELRAAGAAGEPERAGRVFVLPIDPPRYAKLAADLCERSEDLEVRTGCALFDAQRPAAPAGRFELSARTRDGEKLRIETAIVIDASGDANAAALLGASVAEAGSGEVQLPSFIFRMGGVDRSELVGFAKLRLTHAVAGAVHCGDLPSGCESVLVRPGAEPDEVYVTLNIPRPTACPYAPLDEEQLVSLATAARKDAEHIVDFLRRTRPAFEKSHIAAWPTRIGVRESRRIRGVRELDRDDILSGRSDPDEVALSSWPIELWQDHRRAQFEYPQGPCSIPLGALVSRSHPSLGMAGRCLSATHEALGALRVIGTALATGEAIGVAAALAADAGTDLGAIATSDVRAQILERAERESEL
jgi:hypothetical protein